MQVTLTKQKVKKMAQTLKEFSATSPQPASLSQCYEVIAKLFESKDWNTLSASLSQDSVQASVVSQKNIYFEADNVSPMGYSPEYAMLSLDSTTLSQLKTNSAIIFSWDISSKLRLSQETYGLAAKPHVLKANVHVQSQNESFLEKEVYFNIEAATDREKLFLQSYTFPLSLLEQALNLKNKTVGITTIGAVKLIYWKDSVFISPSTWSAVKEYLETSLAFMQISEEEYQELWDLLDAQHD